MAIKDTLLKAGLAGSLVAGGIEAKADQTIQYSFDRAHNQITLTAPTTPFVAWDIQSSPAVGPSANWTNVVSGLFPNQSITLPVNAATPSLFFRASSTPTPGAAVTTEAGTNAPAASTHIAEVPLTGAATNNVTYTEVHPDGTTNTLTSAGTNFAANIGSTNTVSSALDKSEKPKTEITR